MPANALETKTKRHADKIYAHYAILYYVHVRMKMREKIVYSKLYCIVNCIALWKLKIRNHANFFSFLI